MPGTVLVRAVMRGEGPVPPVMRDVVVAAVLRRVGMQVVGSGEGVGRRWIASSAVRVKNWGLARMRVLEGFSMKSESVECSGRNLREEWGEDKEDVDLGKGEHLRCKFLRGLALSQSAIFKLRFEFNR